MNRTQSHIVNMSIITALLGGAPALSAAEISPQYLFNLADFSGAKQYFSARLTLDEKRGETYVLTGDAVAVFNSRGMEIYRIDRDTALGQVYDAIPLDDGTLILLTQLDGKMKLARCNFRGEFQEWITLQGLPESLVTFTPNRTYRRSNRLYLADTNSMQIVVTDLKGQYNKTIDLMTLAGFEEGSKEDAGIGGLSITEDETILFTLPVLARAYRVTADGVVSGWGKRGSAPGRFGNINGIAQDSKGNILVADSLRCVILVFDSKLTFVKEFGQWGFGPGRLIGPGDMVIDAEDRVYVSQLRGRGVSVFKIAQE